MIRRPTTATSWPLETSLAWRWRSWVWANAAGKATATWHCPFFNSLRPEIRAAAVRAIDWLDGDARAHYLLDIMNDPAPRVARAALEALKPRAHLLGADRLWAVLIEAKEPRLRRHTLDLICHLNPWEALHLLLQAYDLPDPEISERAHRFLKSWPHRQDCGAVPATHAQVECIKAARARLGRKKAEIEPTLLEAS